MLISMDGMQFDIFALVIGLLIVVLLWWMYMDYSEKTAIRNVSTNSNVNAPRNNQMPDEKKSSGIAAVLSFFLTGLGQIYNGQILKGLILVFLGSSLFLIPFLPYLILFGAAGTAIGGAGATSAKNVIQGGVILFVILIVFNVILKIYSIYDAYDTARRTHL